MRDIVRCITHQLGTYLSKVFLFLILCAISLLARAEVIPLQDYFVESWTTKDGLPHNSINAIAQTPEGYLKGVRALCDEFGIVMILDEVMAGFGRTGSWFAFEQFGVVPDLITFAKGVNSGYIPAGGVLISEPIAAYFNDHFFPGGLTYSGHPLAMAAIVATLDAMDEEGVVENAAKIGNGVLGEGLKALAAKHPIIGEVRGSGVFWALELVANPQTRQPVPAAIMAEIKSTLLKHGLLPFVVENRIHVVPPCIVTEAEVTQGLAILDSVLGLFDGRCES